MNTQESTIQVSRNLKQSIESKLDLMFFDIDTINDYNYHSVELMKLVLEYITNQQIIVSSKNINKNISTGGTTSIPSSFTTISH